MKTREFLLVLDDAVKESFPEYSVELLFMT
jgi:hypothetical protein